MLIQIAVSVPAIWHAPDWDQSLAACFVLPGMVCRAPGPGGSNVSPARVCSGFLMFFRVKHLLFLLFFWTKKSINSALIA
jgi:hypothetical protein